MLSDLINKDLIIVALVVAVAFPFAVKAYQALTKGLENILGVGKLEKQQETLNDSLTGIAGLRTDIQDLLAEMRAQKARVVEAETLMAQQLQVLTGVLVRFERAVLGGEAAKAGYTPYDPSVAWAQAEIAARVAGGMNLSQAKSSVELEQASAAFQGFLGQNGMQPEQQIAGSDQISFG